MATTAYKKTSLLGGGAGALDGIDGDDLLDGDFAFVFVGSILYVYWLDDDGAAGEDSPSIIVPDANPGTLNWLLVSQNVLSTTLTDGQIVFPATQNTSAGVNTLDDYEEGTWTMGVSFGGGVTGITYGASVGSYTKVGRKVTVIGYCTLTSKGTDNGAALITGLPFTIRNAASGGYAAASVFHLNTSFANQHQAYTLVNTTTILLKEITEAGVVTNLTDANFANDSQYVIELTYEED